jgi:hypothetical protein
MLNGVRQMARNRSWNDATVAVFSQFRKSFLLRSLLDEYHIQLTRSHYTFVFNKLIAGGFSAFVIDMS